MRARFSTTDRAELAAIVFSDVSARAELEALSWPVIDTQLRGRVEQSMADVVVLDMAVLAQGDLGKGLYEAVVTVEAPEQIRLTRLVGRGMRHDDARARMAAQVSEARRRELADFVVDNGAGIEDLELATQRLWTDLTARRGAAGFA